jgi:hypothetical protein
MNLQNTFFDKILQFIKVCGWARFVIWNSKIKKKF